MNDLYKSSLKQLNLINENNSKIEGFKFIGDTDTSEYEKFHIEDVKLYNADAVFFKKFENDISQPIAYIYDNTDIEKNEKETSELYMQLWNSCKIPFFIIITKTEIKIFNCYKKPEFDDNNNIKPSVFDIIKISSEIIKTFNALKFYSGDFWNDLKVENAINNKESAYQSLLTELKNIRKEIKSANILSPKTADSILIKFILIKYLEERKVFDKNFWNSIESTSKSFIDLFNNGSNLINLFDNLSSHFNGGIFKLTDQEKNEIRNKNLESFAEFFKGETENGQRTFWRNYSFEYLPIELISNIYEEFLENEDGVVYTPPILVNFMIDDIMPLDKKPKDNYKILDPSCGSGVFLVAAFKRIIQWWRIKNNYKKPEVAELKQIIKDSIFGIDVEEESVRLAVFSLCLAICDLLSPEKIWKELVFDDLSKTNVIKDDFFNIIENKSEYLNNFDLILGNPPFKSKLTDVAQKIDNDRDHHVKVPDNQMALLFLEQSFKLCKENGYVVLIQPSGPLLYNHNSYDFRQYLFSKYKCLEVIDFTSLKSSIFEDRANVAVASVIFKNCEPDKNDKILHVTVRDTKPSKEKIYFEIDKYDFHWITLDDVLDNKIIWKINLLGGGRIKHLINRMSNHRTLGEYINEKVKNNGWAFQEGYIINRSGNKIAKYITGKQNLPIKGLTENGIDFNKTRIEDKTLFYRISEESVFTPPHLLIKEVVGKDSMIIEYSDEYLTFMNSIIGLHAPYNDMDKLKQIYTRLKFNKFYLFHFSISSGRYLINKATSLLKDDIEVLPFPENDSDLELSELEQIVVNDTLDYMVDYCKGKKNPAILNSVPKNQLKEYGELYCKLLNSVYEKFILHEPVNTGSFICYPFSYGDNEIETFDKSKNIDNYLSDLVYNKSGESLLLKKIVLLYDDKNIYIIKPIQLKYWLKSTAIKDADETFSDLITMGY